MKKCPFRFKNDDPTCIEHECLAFEMKQSVYTVEDYGGYQSTQINCYYVCKAMGEVFLRSA